MVLRFERGFLPSEDPLQKLPESAQPEFEFNAWLNATVENLPSLIKSKNLRTTIDAFNKKLNSHTPFININRLDSSQINNAFAIITSLIQAYVWEQLDKPVRVIPRILAENIYDLLKYNPRVPVLTYADYVLYNWRRLDANKEITLENVEPLYMFTGHAEEAWFIKIHVVIESTFAPAIAAACKIHTLSKTPEHVPNRDALYTQYLTEMAQSTEKAADVLGKMFDGCTPDFFFNVLRPYLEGTDKAGGIIFDLQDSSAQEAVLYRGSSGAQSSTLPALDAVLGIDLPNDQMSKGLKDFINYMPNTDKLFILALKNTNIPNTPEKSNAIEKLRDFREKHLKMPAEYIVKQALKKGIPLDQVTGTGSTNLGKFLKDREIATGEAAKK